MSEFDWIDEVANRANAAGYDSVMAYAAALEQILGFVHDRVHDRESPLSVRLGEIDAALRGVVRKSAV